MCSTPSHTAHVCVHGPTRRARIHTPEPDLVRHNVLHVAGHNKTEKGRHDMRAYLALRDMRAYLALRG